MNGNVNDYVSRLSKYYKVFGQFASSQQPRYRVKVNDNVEIKLSQDNSDVVVALVFRPRGADDIKAVQSALERLITEGVEVTSCVQLDTAEKSNTF